MKSKNERVLLDSCTRIADYTEEYRRCRLRNGYTVEITTEYNKTYGHFNAKLEVLGGWKHIEFTGFDVAEIPEILDFIEEWTMLREFEPEEIDGF